jgi:septum formation protein
VLASASPRRKDILEQLGLSFRVIPSGFDETLLPGETPEQHVERLARGKAAEIARRLADDPERPCVLAADTVVVIDRLILGKPADDDDALRMLGLLAGRVHRVLTGFAITDAGAISGESAVVATDVTFRPLASDDLRAYIASGEGRDKAGSYAIQGLGAGLVSQIEGSYTNVVGLPAVETVDALKRAGVLERWP